MTRKNGRACGTSICWHCQHPQWKRRCLGSGGTKDDADKDFQDRTQRRNKRGESAKAITDANAGVRAERASARPTRSMKASTPVAAQACGREAKPTAAPAHVAGKKRSIMQMLQGSPCRDEPEPIEPAHVPSITMLSVPVEPAHVPTNIAGQSKDTKGHYATLGLQPGASLEEVRKAYRRRSLETHPDKGGNASQFRKVGEAFLMLSDELKCADRNNGRDASAASARGSPDNDESAMHPVCLAMLTLPRGSWRGLLVGLKPEVLKALCTTLNEGTVTEAPCPDEDGEPTGGSTSDGSSRGVYGKAGNYIVKLGWRHFYVKSGRPIRTLDQALDILVCLSWLRNTAMLRYEERAQDLRRAERGHDHSMMNSTDDCCPPLLPCELHEMLLMLHDPLMHFVFSFDLTKKPRMQSPWTPRIDAAEHHQDLIRRVQARKYRSLTTTVDPKVEIASMMQEQARRERDGRKALEHSMAAEVAAEVARRQCEPPPAPADARVPCDTLALGHSAQLALLDECREAMIATKHSTEAMQEELRNRAAADDARHAHERRLQDDYQRERDDRRRADEKIEKLTKQLEKRTSSSADIARLEKDNAELENEVLRLQSMQNPRQPVTAVAFHGGQSRISWRPEPFSHLQAGQNEAVQNQAAKREIARMNTTRQTAQQAALETARRL